MSTYQFVTKEAAEDYYITGRPMGFTYSKDLLYQCIDACVSSIVEADHFDPKISLIEIDNYKGIMSSNFVAAINVLYRHKLTPSDCEYRSHIVEYTKDIFGSHGCKLKIDVICPKCHELECHCKTSTISLSSAEAEYRFPEILANLTHASRVESGNPESPFFTGFYKKDKRWQLIRPAQNHFFAHTDHIGNCVNFNIEHEIEYRIDNPTIRLNISDGWVLMAALHYQTDDDGYRLVPSIPIVFRLINTWMDCETALLNYNSTMDPKYGNLWQVLDRKRLDLLRTARGEINAFEPDESEAWNKNVYTKMLAHYNYKHTLGRFLPDKYNYHRS